ncbi:MAG: anthranilate synthase component II [Fusobacteriota bacterium]
MILMIDNYDSFTYNLVQYFGILGEEIEVIRNDKLSLEDIRKIDPEAIVISPGPGTPDDAGISLEIIENLKGDYPILGVCLGHQAIGQVFGSKIVHAENIMHGKTSKIYHENMGVFKNLENPLEATRYHSLIIDKNTLGKDLQITAWTKENEIMGIRHKKYFIEGVQFHPESILTKSGLKMLENFLNEIRENEQR